MTHSSMPARAPRFTIARLLAALVALVVCLYAGAIVWLVANETEIVFEAGRPLAQSRPAFAYEQIDLPRRDGARQFAWVMPAPSARVWILYLHGNSATIASRVNIARYRELRALGASVIAPEYRGFAGLPGTPRESTVAEDARAAFEYLTRTRGIAPAQIVIYGWSLGSAVAVTLASEVAAGGLILEGAPASLVAIGQQRYPIFPIRLLIRNPFESIQRIGRVRAPVLFLHSPADDIIPIAEGRRLFDAAPEPKRFVEVRGGHIYANEVDQQAFFGAIRAFLNEYVTRDAG